MAGVNEVAKQAGVKPEIVQNVLASIKDIAAKESVIIRGHGTFKTVTRAARTARNPSTGQPVAVPAKTVLKFTPSK